MYRQLFATVGVCASVAAAAVLTSGAAPAVAVASTQPPHIMLIIEENTSYSSADGSPYIVGNSKAPYFNKLAQQYALATKWYANEHDSPKDYLNLLAGSDFAGQSKPYAGPTLVDELAAKSIPWKAYMEGMPSACYTGSGSGTNNYTQSHNPFLDFTSTKTGPLCQNVVPMGSNFQSDLNNTTNPPALMWVTPNTCNDMHSQCGGNAVANGDSWLSTTIPTVMKSPWYTTGNGVIIVEFDEGTIKDTSGGSYGNGGHIATLVISKSSSGQFTSPGNHFGVLKAIEESYGVGLLRGSNSTSVGDIRPAFGSGGATSPGSITGTVSDADTAGSIAGATVTCSCSSTNATTGSGGAYSFGSVSPGSYSLTVGKSGYVTKTISNVTVSSGSTTTQNASLDEVGSISGTVTDASTQQPLAGATVGCSPCTGAANTSATTNASGFYAITGLDTSSTSSNTLSFSAASHQPATHSNVVVPQGGAAPGQSAALAPTGSGPVFSDGFETSPGPWTTVNANMSIESTTVHSGTKAAQGTASASTAFAEKTLATTYTDAYARTWFYVQSQSSQVGVLGLRSAADANLAFLAINSTGHLLMNVKGTAYTSAGPGIAAGEWHELELHLVINGSAGSTQVWLDGAQINDLSLANISTGTTPVGELVVGWSSNNTETWSMVLDDAALDTSFLV